MKTLTLSFLGKFQCSYQDSPITTFRSDKIRALLVYLAMEADTPHRRESLAALFWPENTHAIALRNLRKSLHRLRQTLDAAAPELSTAVLTITRQTVQLNKTAVSTDTHTFEETLATVETHPHRTMLDCSTCMDALCQAADLYQGELLAGLSLPDAVPFEEWLLMKRELLHQQALNILHTLTVTHEKQGNYEQAYAYGLRQTALEPWREEAHRQLMRTLARQGERSRALAQYELCRDLLMKELGVLPSPKTAVLYDQIKQGTFSDAAEQTAVSLHHFPTPFTTFVGRNEEVIAVADHLLNPDCRLLTIIGTGGMGKTRLSQQAVHYIIDKHPSAANDLFPDGCYFVPLADAENREQLVTSMAKALQITFQAMEQPEQQLSNYLAGKKLLLLLDNFEQLVGETAVFITELLHAAPAVQLLISSREALNTQAEWRLALDGLASPPADETNPASYAATRLFMQTAQRVQPDFQPNTTEWNAIARICELTQGVPLALEIAAAWVRMMDCGAIAEQIGRHFDFLKATSRDIPDRHRSMRVVFEQSWSYLSPTAQATLAQLSIFHGGFDLDAALAVMNDAMTELSGLLDKSLLRREKNGRYTLHELLRKFAAEKLTTGDGNVARQARQAHSTYYLHLITAQKEAFHAKTMVGWNRTQVEIDNIRAAWQWAVNNGRWDSITDAMDGLSLFYQLNGLFQEGVTVFGAAASRLEMENDGAEGKTAVNTLNQLRLHHIHILIDQNNYAKAAQLAQTAVDSCRQSGNEHQLSIALAELGIAHWRLDNVDDAKLQLSESLAIATRLNAPQQMAYALHHLGTIAIFQRKNEDARLALQEAITLYEKLDDMRGLANVLTDVGSLNIIDGVFETAGRYYRRSAALHQKINNPTGAILPLGNLGYLALVVGDYEMAEQYVEEVYAYAVTYGLNLLQVNLLNNFGHIALMRKEYPRAVVQYQKSLQLATATENKVESLLGLTAVIATTNPQIAAQLFATVKINQSDKMVAFGPFEETVYQQQLGDTRAALSDAEWQTAVSIGTALTLDEAISLALSYT